MGNIPTKEIFTPYYHSVNVLFMSRKSSALSSIIVLDDHPLLRKGVASIIETIDSEIEIVQSGSLSDCIELIDLYSPDLIIADLNLPDAQGIDSLKSLIKLTSAPILVYSLKAEELVGPACYKNGAKAYVMKDASTDHLESAIVSLLDGGTWCSPTLAARLMAGNAAQGTSGVELLSNREMEIFENLGRGQTVKEIAFDLNLSPKTIESHRDRIKTKLSLPNSNALIIKAKDWLSG